MKRYDIIVVGAGGVGSAALFHLARRGVKVLGIDRFNPPHNQGSTHGHTRVIRQAYFEHLDYVPLLVESYRLWHELERLCGRQLFFQVGLVEAGPADGHVVPGVLRSSAQHGIGVVQLSASAAERRWPGLHVGDHLTTVFEPSAGYLLVEDCVAAHLDAARSAGAEIVTDTEVQSWTAKDSGVRVETNRGDIAADRLVIAAGAWAAELLAGLGTGLVVRRKSLLWYATDGPAYHVSAGFPVFLFELPAGIYYGFPKLDPRGVKVAEHTGGQVIENPLAVDRSLGQDEEQRVAEFRAAHLPGVSRHVAHHAVCLYTMSPDEHFIVDRHPRHANVVFAAGLSGHGFKFVPVLGRALAELALDGGTALPIGFLSRSRFER
jgi:monomeric sarcosine oxidase